MNGLPPITVPDELVDELVKCAIEFADASESLAQLPDEADCQPALDRCDLAEADLIGVVARLRVRGMAPGEAYEAGVRAGRRPRADHGEARRVAGTPSGPDPVALIMLAAVTSTVTILMIFRVLDLL